MDNVTLDDLAEVLGEVIDLSGVCLTEGMVLGEDIRIDSREMLRALSRLESRYRFRFAPQDVQAVKTVGDLLRLVRLRAGSSS